MANKIIEIGSCASGRVLWFRSYVTLSGPIRRPNRPYLLIIMVWKLSLTSSKANRPKKKEWIEDYYLQIAAMYAMAHDYVYGSQIKQGVIMVCTPDLYYQEFKVEGAELRRYKHEALKRIDMYYDLMHR